MKVGRDVYTFGITDVANSKPLNLDNHCINLHIIIDKMYFVFCKN